MKPKIKDTTLLVATFVFALLVLALQRFPGERWWPTIFLVYSPQLIWMIPTFAVMIYFAVRRKWLFSAALIPAIIIPSVVSMGAKVPARQSRDTYTVRVLTWNLYYGRGGPSLAELASRVSPDIICLQESNPWADKSLSTLLKQPEFSGWQANQCGELVTLSRFPLKRLRTTNSALWIEADMGGTKLTVVNAHLALPVLHTMGDVIDRSELYAADRRRRPQVRGILENLPHGAPVVVCGDFNTTPNSEVYREFTSRLVSSFDVAGQGIGLTFPKQFPLLRIDHVFVTKAFKPIRCWYPDIDASNHKPVCVDLKLSPSY